jgi:hypothetical protein
VKVARNPRIPNVLLDLETRDDIRIVEFDHHFQDSELINAVAINNPFIGL